MKKFLLFITVLISLLTLSACSETNEKIPTSLPDKTYVYDPHKHLSEDTINEITKLNEEWKKTDQQFTVAVLMIDNLNGQSIEEISNKTARNWKIGYSGTNNGVLITIATSDRKYRIETSDNVATKITDNQTRIIRERAKDALSDEEWDKGTLSMVKDLGDTFYGKTLKTDYGWNTMLLVGGIIILIGIAFVLVVVFDGGSSGGDFSGGFFSSDSSGGGFSGGDFSGGFFSSDSSGGGFSGGGFSGGGSSGGF